MEAPANVSQTSQEDEMANEDEEMANEKRIRREYRQYREEMIENRNECIDPNSNLIENILEKVERTFKSVKKPREAVSDSNTLHELAILGTERIKNLKCAFRSFNNNEFMDKLKAYIGDNSSKNEPTIRGEDDEEEDFLSDADETRTLQSRRSTKKNAPKKYILTQPIMATFGTNVMSHFRIAPRPKFLLGALEHQVVLGKKQVVRQKRAEKRDDEAVRTKIKELDVNSKETEINPTVGETERIEKLLKRGFKRSKGCPLCLYEFAIHPTSFSRTIENIFYISFLVKDGYAQIFLDDDGLPVIEPVGEAERVESQTIKNKKMNIQSMISLNKRQWQEIIEVFEITGPAIPDLK